VIFQRTVLKRGWEVGKLKGVVGGPGPGTGDLEWKSRTASLVRSWLLMVTEPGMW
jgi:hypothetical protein